MHRDDISARSSKAQASRDRLRLAAAVSEIARLRANVSALEKKPLLRAERKARELFRSLPSWIRVPVFRLLRGQGVSAVPDEKPAAAPPRGIACVIDDHWPTPDRDSGSVDIVNLLHVLRDAGFRVHFLATRENKSSSAAEESLKASGVETWAPEDTPVDGDPVERFFALNGDTIDICVLCRVYCGGRYLEVVQNYCKKARIIFNSVDLCFLRETRRAQILNDTLLLDAAREMQQREEHLIRVCDATMVVSSAELNLLQLQIPEAYVVELPLARPLARPLKDFAARYGIGFIGGFAHAPNVDAMRYFLDAIWPKLLHEFPQASLSIVGPDFPISLLDGCPGTVQALGHVADVSRWFESLRVTIAPLRYGAGAKGKIASSLAAGVPCVTTPLGIEGMHLEDGRGVVVAATPDDFAASIKAVHEDEAQWTRLSHGAVAHATESLSISGWQQRVLAMLERLGFADVRPAVTVIAKHAA